MRTGSMKYYVETGWCGNWDDLCNCWDAHYSDENAEWFDNFDEAQQRFDWLANSNLGKNGVYVTLCDNNDKEILRFETDNEGNIDVWEVEK
ncbi:MAG: hypothetical protein ACLRT4_20220 [Thomasclavelia sp.]